MSNVIVIAVQSGHDVLWRVFHAKPNDCRAVWASTHEEATLPRLALKTAKGWVFIQLAVRERERTAWPVGLA